MSDKVFLVKLFSETSDSYFRAMTSLRDKDFHILLIKDNERAFRCELTRDDLEKQGEKQRIDDLYQWGKNAFTMSNPDFKFSLTNDDKLMWKKSSDKKSKIMIKVGAFPLEEVDVHEANIEMFEKAAAQIEFLSSEHADLSRRYNKLIDQQRATKANMEAFIKEKSNLEQNIYSKFMPILQSKHDRIEDLEADLEDIQRRGGNCGEKRKTTTEEKDDEYGSSTDVDDDPDDQETPGKKFKSSNTSLSSHNDSHNDSQNVLF